MSGLQVVPLPLDAEVGEGDDLAAHVLDALAAAGQRLRRGDVLCVASKVVAKAEGAYAALPPGDPAVARRAVARTQAAAVVADTPWVLVVRTHHGFVCANAGVDASNVPGDDRLLLLPRDPDASAAALRDALGRATDTAPGVVVTDTFGRPWRLGQTDVALGAAGVVTLRDDRGRNDRHGRVLDVTQVAVADQLAAAADLVRHKADGTPFVLLRGLDVAGDQTAADLVRQSGEDLFRHGGPDAVTAGNAAAVVEQRPPGEPGRVSVGDVGDDPAAAAVDPVLVARVADAARTALLHVEVDTDQGGVVLRADDAVALGAALQAAAATATALGLRTTLERERDRLRLGFDVARAGGHGQG